MTLVALVAFRSILNTVNADTHKKFLILIANGEVIIKICTKT